MNDSTTQSEVTPSVCCWVGLDWADKKHHLAVRTQPSKPAQEYQVEQQPEKLDEFFLNLRAQHPAGLIAVGIEQSRGPVIYALMKFDFLLLYPINPRALSDYRGAFKISGAKDDHLDADLLCELVAQHADRLRPLVVEDATTRQLRLLTEARRHFVEERTACINQLQATLKCYYPLALELVGEGLTSKLAGDFLRRFPNLAKLQAAKPSVLRAFFYDHNSRSEDRISARLESIKTARPLTEDPALVEPYQLRMVCLVAQISTLNKTIEQYDERIQKVFATHSLKELFSALPGAGPALAPRLAAVFGTNRSNYQKALDVLSFTGVAPVRKQSGNSQTVHFRYARPIFLHQTLVEFAKCSLPRCAWARLLFEHELGKGKTKWSAIRKVAFKWIRILWRCWQNNEAYDEAKYLQSLKQHSATLYRSLYEPAAPSLQNSSQ